MIQKSKRLKRSFHQRVIFSILLGILVIGAIGFLFISNLKINKKRAELRAKIEALKKEIQILEEKNQKLKAGILERKKESYWEEKIRQEGYRRPGEEQVVILPPPEKIEEEKEREEKNSWQRFLEKVGF